MTISHELPVRTASPSPVAALDRFIDELPKAEIHVHLEGSIQPETLLQLAQRHQRLDYLPARDVAELRRQFQFTDFAHFVRIYLLICDLLRTPADFALIVHACGADMAAQNIRYREVTVTPFTHVDYLHKGLTIDDVIAGLEAGRASARHDFGVEIRWVFDIPRDFCLPGQNSSFDPYPAQRTLDYARRGQAHGVVGFGLGGSEMVAPPEPFAPFFAAAKVSGLLAVPHAGETVGPPGIWNAVTLLKADRIGHGVRAMEDPALLTLLRDCQIPLEVNPSSNVCLHVYRSMAEHPFPHLDRMGIKVTINSDDPPLFNTSLTNEYRTVARTFGYNQVDLARLARNAFEVCGAEPVLKRKMLAEFDDWVGTEQVAR